MLRAQQGDGEGSGGGHCFDTGCQAGEEASLSCRAARNPTWLWDFPNVEADGAQGI